VLDSQPAGVDRCLHPADVHLVELLGKDVVEPALGQTPVQWHLAAFEPLDAHARARGLALAAAAAGLAHARADAAPDAHAAFARPGPMGRLVELPRSLLALRPRLAARRNLKLFAPDHAHEVRDLADHAANRRRVGQLGHPADAVEPEPDQGFPLRVLTADR